MRASRRWLLLAVAAWLLAMLAHAAFTAWPMWRIQANERLPWVQGFRAAPPSTCRVVVVGSSPALFGLSTQTLQAATGCATWNLAMIGIGDQVEDYLSAVLSDVRPGDIVLLSDRRWTAYDTAPQPCTDGQPLRCWLSALRAVPHLADDWGLLGDGRLQRDARGNLLTYPKLPGDAEPLAQPGLANEAYRLDALQRQAHKVRAAGAVPVLVGVPVLATPEAQAAIQADYTAFAPRVTAAIAPTLWIGPWVSSNPSDFTPEGLHLSSLGREQWSGKVAKALQGLLPARVGNDQAAAR